MLDPRRLLPLALLTGMAILAGCQGETAPEATERGKVSVAVEQFGVGSAVRPGEFAALRVTLLSGLPESSEVWVQWELPNGDGDIAAYGRVVPLPSGVPRQVWLYARLPPDTTAESTWPVRVFRGRDNLGAEIGGILVSASGQATPIAGGAPLIHLNASLIGVVGPEQMGLEDYRTMGVGARPVRTSHEDTYIAAGIEPRNLPDAWEGLLQFEALVWGPSRPPGDLSTPAAGALRDYIRRGGHLVIVLPAGQNTWGIGQPLDTHELADLLPPNALRQDDGVKLSEILPLLSKSRSVGVDVVMSLNVFATLDGSFDALGPDTPYEPLLVTPDGRVIGVQRLYGHGRVTLVGFQPTMQMRRLDAAGGTAVPQADVFWNRILGRRQDTPTSPELVAIADGKMLLETNPLENDLHGGALAADVIAMGQQATQGLLLAVVLFLAYWIVAGPGGFFALKRYRRVQHAWVAFAVTAGVFTAVAWGSVSLIRSQRVQVQHLTFIDHIAVPSDIDATGEAVQTHRAFGWFSAYLPGYGSTRVEIVPSPRERNLLDSWTPPAAERTAFRNVDFYSVDVDDAPASIDIPSRATSTQFAAHWMGNVDADWGRMIRGRVTTDRDPAGNERLNIDLQHELPGTLQHVLMIWVRNQRLTTTYAPFGEGERPWVSAFDSGSLPNNGTILRRAEWRPDESWTQSFTPDGQSVARTVLRSSYYEPFDEIGGLTSGVTDDRRRTYLEMLSLFQMLPPPPYLKTSENDTSRPAVPLFFRRIGREADLSAWFTRPCLIVIGYLRDSPMPIPLRVDGEQPQSTGMTVVRWIHPLPIDPDIAFALPPRPDGATPAADEPE